MYELKMKKAAVLRKKVGKNQPEFFNFELIFP